MKRRMLRLGLSLILGIGWWTNRLPAASAYSTQAAPLTGEAPATND
jgi:hypothetical protein